MDINIKKFIKGKPVLTKDNIIQRLLREYRYYIKGFLLKNADELLLYCLWDYKIEIRLGKQPLYYKNCPLSFTKL